MHLVTPPPLTLVPTLIPLAPPHPLFPQPLGLNYDTAKVRTSLGLDGPHANLKPISHECLDAALDLFWLAWEFHLSSALRWSILRG